MRIYLKVIKQFGIVQNQDADQSSIPPVLKCDGIRTYRGKLQT